MRSQLPNTLPVLEFREAVILRHRHNRLRHDRHELREYRSGHYVAVVPHLRNPCPFWLSTRLGGRASIDERNAVSLLQNVRKSHLALRNSVRPMLSFDTCEFTGIEPIRVQGWFTCEIVYESAWR
jgi:hypothetical protein